MGFIDPHHDLINDPRFSHDLDKMIKPDPSTRWCYPSTTDIEEMVKLVREGSYTGPYVVYVDGLWYHADENGELIHRISGV